MNKLRKLIGFPVEYAQDMWQYFRHNGHSPLAPRNQRLFYHTVIRSHTIEKGLALYKPRPLFGRDKIRGLLAMLRRYDASQSTFPVEMAHGALRAYQEFNRIEGLEDPIFSEIDDGLVADVPVFLSGGVKAIEPGERWKDHLVATAFLRSRASCRMFAPERLDVAAVEALVRTAQTAPSQCNRQATKVHFFQEPKQIANLLRLQGGAGGFSEEILNLFVITSDIMAWGGPQQRNQLYVDGGLFCMTLMLAAHGSGLATCPLNLAVTNGVEQRIKREASIPANERVIMMIAVGVPKANGLKAAKSPRRPSGEVLVKHLT